MSEEKQMNKRNQPGAVSTTPESEQFDEELLAARKEAYRVGISVAILLAAFTLGEYWIGSVASTWWAPLVGIALLKATLILRDYMHVGRLFAAEEESHS